MKRVLTQMRPNKFDHLVATIALYRPGPMDYIPEYIARLHGEKQIEYHHPALEPILSDTYGIMVYQEQIMRIARDCCGYTGGEADTLRKAVGKKNKEAILKQREKFIKGAENAGIIPAETAEKIFDDIEFFARYGFNKSHAAVYGVLTGQTAFLKAHYTIEYLTALLSTDIGNTEKVAMFVTDARNQNIPVLPPDVRYSDVKFTIDDTQGTRGGIRFGLLGVKNVGEGPIQAILDGRGDKPFETLDDFCTRVDLKQVNRRVLESLIKAGAFDAFGHRAQLLEAIDRMLSVSSSHHNASAAGQMSLFGGAIAVDTFGDLPNVTAVDHKAQLEWEKELMGVYFSPHPLLKLTASGKKHVSMFTSEITNENDGQQVTVGGIIKTVRQITTKKGDAMAFLQVEDPQGVIEVVAFPRAFNDYRDVIHEDALILVRGKVQVRDDKIAVLADLIWNYPVEALPEETPREPNRPIPGILSNTPIIMPAPAPTVNDFVERVTDEWMPPPGDWDDDAASAVDAPAAEQNITVENAPVAQAEIENAPAVLDTDVTTNEPTAELNWNAADSVDASQPAQTDDAATKDNASNAPVASAEVPAAPTQNNSPLATPPTNFVPPLVLQSQVVEPKPEPPPAAPPPPPPKAALPEIKLGGGVAIPSKNGGNGHAQHGPTAPRSNGSPAQARESSSAYMPRTSSNLKVRVRLQRTNNVELDTKHMRDVVKLLRSADGRDRFALIVPMQESWVELDFPNYYTNFQTVQGPLLEMVSDWGEVEIG